MIVILTRYFKIDNIYPLSDLTEQSIGSTVYTEHNDGYLFEYLEKLRSKAIEIQG